MSPLNLPEYAPRTKGDEIFCLVRRKYVVLFPEEWVRQHFLNLLIEYLDYPRGMIKLEHTLSYFKNQKRSDITVLDRDGTVSLLVECKSHKVALNEKVVKQVAEYNKIIDAKYIAVTNGLKHFVWKREGEAFEQLTNFPKFE